MFIALTEPPVRYCVSEDLEAAALNGVGDILELEAETEVGLVRAEALHCLMPCHALKRELYVDALELLEETGEELFVHIHDVVLGHVGHLEVDLGELRLSVGAEILVTEAARDLEVSVKSGEHQKLLVELRRLRQSVELAVMYAARHEVVTRTLRRRLDEARGLDVDEAVPRRSSRGRSSLFCFLR